MQALTAEVKRCLELRQGQNVVVTLGNACRGDDGVGPYIAARLVTRDGLTVIDAATTPENFVEELIALNPAYILFLDAADFGGAPGEARLIAPADIPDFTLSTHMFPLSAICGLIASVIPAEIRVLGVQIADCSFGEGLSAAVKETAEAVAAGLSRNAAG
jgi:hydrogenase 3 maturation protease